MEYNTVEKDKIYLGEVEFSNLVKVLTRAYEFRNNNQKPKAVVIPKLTSVNGVAVEYEESPNGKQ